MKKFLVQIQPGAETRWLINDEQLETLIAQEVGRAVLLNTGGKVPSVTVTREECRCEICADKARQPDAMRG